MRRYEAPSLLPTPRQRILDVLLAEPGLTAREVVQRLGLPRELIDPLFVDLARSGEIEIRCLSQSRRRWIVKTI